MTTSINVDKRSVKQLLETGKNKRFIMNNQKLLYPYAEDDAPRFGVGPTTEKFPSGLACAPFCWQYFDDSYQMEFLGGFIGIKQEAETLRLKPEIGWAVRERMQSK